MKRAIVAPFAPAIVYAPFFGPMIVLALPVMVALTAAIGLPLRYLFRAKTRMRWWLCSAAGMLIALPVVTPLLAISVRRSWMLQAQHYRYRRLLPGTCGAGCN